MSPAAIAVRPIPNRELLVVLAEQPRSMAASAYGSPSAPTPAADAIPSSIAGYLRDMRAAIHPLFGTALRFQARQAELPSAPAAGISLSQFFRINAPDAAMDRIVEKLRSDSSVLAAYVKPPGEPPQFGTAFGPPVNGMTPNLVPSPSVTPDFSGRQAYLNPAPEGVDARFAWAQAGGKGEGIAIIDIEGDWRLTHEDLLQIEGGLAGGILAQQLDWRNHGTAVLGVFGADENGIGVTGIAPASSIRVISIYGWPGGPSTSAAIAHAATLLHPGSILLIEIHRAGPRFGFTPRQDQRGYIAVEWWPDDFAAIQYATNRGIMVVEPAGNGAENLDDPLYATPDPGFPPDWKNPFTRSLADSGAILVGAGSPPAGTHDRAPGPDRSRLSFSNWGFSLDAQGWGSEVTSCGYGDLQGGTEDEYYTDTFGGTSSASPTVVGALACLQGIRLAQGKSLLTPAEARSLLRRTGSPQQSSPSAPGLQRIGSRPDLRQLLAAMP